MFSAEIQSAFKAVVDEEFAAAQEKAGISIAVFSGGMLWTYALGEASSTTHMTTSTPIPIGSTSKTFVSALVLTQIAEGLYELTDSLEQVLSGHPAYESFDKTRINPDVTVEEMLAMRSGLADFNDNREGTQGLFSNATWEPADNVNLVQASFAEAGAFDYNDTNLVLLGLVAEFHGNGKKGIDRRFKITARAEGLFAASHDRNPANSDKNIKIYILYSIRQSGHGLGTD